MTPFTLESQLGDVLDGTIDLTSILTTTGADDAERIQMDLSFDRYPEKKSLGELPETLRKLTRVSPELHRPPVVLMTWGSGLQFKGVLESFALQFTLFLDERTPVRAQAVLDLLVTDDLGPCR